MLHISCTCSVGMWVSGRVPRTYGLGSVPRPSVLGSTCSTQVALDLMACVGQWEGAKDIRPWQCAKAKRPWQYMLHTSCT